MAVAKKTVVKKVATSTKKAPAKKATAKKAPTKRTPAKKEAPMGKIKVGDQVTVLVDPRMNNGSDEAVGVVVRVWGSEMVNLRVLCDGPETLWLTSVNVVKKRPYFPEGEQPPRVCFK